ncbi:MAG TPA: CocE/NonD family hydrolase [Acidimicrobiales bacterium]|nr:CocE/NonD family hydrolase [Acidimicrobiales bacterium]
MSETLTVSEPVVEVGADRKQLDVMMPARDGVRLATDFYFPEGHGPWPALVARTCYIKDNPGLGRMADAYNRRGYVLAIQDVRGRGKSEGEFAPWRQEPNDGYDTFEWVARQSWSDGNIATQGASYSAQASWLTALTKPPSLKAMVISTAPSDPFVEFPTCGITLSMLLWYSVTGNREMPAGLREVDWTTVFKHLPLETMDEAAGLSSKLWRDTMMHPRLDEYWEPLRYQHRIHEIDIPVMHISGWYDDEQIGTPLNYSRVSTGAPSEETRKRQRLLMGPWGHAVNTTSKIGDVEFGPDALIDLQRRMIDFLDWSLGREQQLDTAPVRIFVMGANRWRDEKEWPLARAQYTDYFLRSDGVLDTTAPSRDEPADSYRYDPSDPTPFIFDYGTLQIGGPDDYAEVGKRADVLTFTTPPLTEDLEVTGPVRARLFVSSSAVDTDFAALLVDVHPDGFCQRLCDGIVRARYREGVDREVFMEAGQVYELDIDMWNTCQVFKAGHQLRLQVSSAAFPKCDRNLNTGEPIASSTRMEIAENSIWHDAAHPSSVILPVIPVPVRSAPPATSAGSQDQTSHDAPTSERAHEVLEQLLAENGIPGAALAVIHNGEVVATAAAGMANPDTGLQVTNDTIFESGSVGKVYTATLVMQLVDEGLVDIEKPIVEYLPELRLADEDARNSITARHLLTHTSGLDGDKMGGPLYGTEDDAIERYVADLGDLSSLQRPGGYWAYSNAGLVILGRLVEVLRGKSFRAALQDHLFTPAGLTDTTSFTAEFPGRELAFGTAPGPDGEVRVTGPGGLGRAMVPAGGVMSTAKDLAAFGQIHLAGGVAPNGTRILTEESVRAMQEPLVECPTRIPASHWGLGWFMSLDHGPKVIGHDGNTGGQTAFLRVIPDKQISVALLTNRDHVNELIIPLMNRLIDGWAGTVTTGARKPVDGLALDLERYIGDYANIAGRNTIHIVDGTLRLTGSGMQGLELLPAEEDVFYTHVAGIGDLEATFLDPDEKGRTQYLHFGGRISKRSDEPAADDATEAEPVSPEVLRQVVGKYSVSGVTIEVKGTAGGGVILLQSGMEIPLKSEGGLKFSVPMQPGMSLEFVLGSDGFASEITSPAGTLTREAS